MEKEDKKPKQKVFNQRWLKYSRNAFNLWALNNVFLRLNSVEIYFALEVLKEIDAMQLKTFEVLKEHKVLDITKILKANKIRITRQQALKTFFTLKTYYWKETLTPIKADKSSPLYGKKSIITHQPIFYLLNIYTYKQRQYLIFKINPLFGECFGSDIKNNYAVFYQKLKKLTYHLSILIVEIFNPHKTIFNIKVKKFLLCFEKNPEQLKKLLFILNSKIIKEFNNNQKYIKVISINKQDDHIQIVMETQNNKLLVSAPEPIRELPLPEPKTPTKKDPKDKKPFNSFNELFKY